MLLRGVPLEQVAAVHAAVAEGFDLDEVLAVEGLPKRAWFEAELSWKRRLVEDDAVFAAYERELNDHQEKLSRRVSPIDQDVEAWVTFLRLYGDHDEPFVWLGELGLALPDLSRLSRHWTSRFEAEPRLAKKATKLAKKLEDRAADGKAVVLERVTVGARALLASAAAGSFVEATGVDDGGAEVAPEVTAPVMGLDRYAALTAKLTDWLLAPPSGVPEPYLAPVGPTAAGTAAVARLWRRASPLFSAVIAVVNPLNISVPAQFALHGADATTALRARTSSRRTAPLFGSKTRRQTRRTIGEWYRQRSTRCSTPQLTSPDTQTASTCRRLSSLRPPNDPTRGENRLSEQWLHMHNSCRAHPTRSNFGLCASSPGLELDQVFGAHLV